MEVWQPDQHYWFGEENSYPSEVPFQWKLVAVNGSILFVREISEGENMFGYTALIRTTVQWKAPERFWAGEHTVYYGRRGRYARLPQ